MFLSWNKLFGGFQLGWKGTIAIGVAIALLVFIGPAMAQPINEGATPAKPDISVKFSVDNPDVTIYAVLPGPGGENSTDAYAELTLNGTGSAYGTFEAHSNTDTRWANLHGDYVGSEGDFSSTFTAEGVRQNSTMTFLTSQSVQATGVGSAEITTPVGDVVRGLYVYGQAGVCSVADTWAVGAGQVFKGTAESLTVTVDRRYEHRASDGSLLAPSLNAQFSVAATGGDTFSGYTEGGSYDAATLGLPVQTGFGCAASMLSLELKTGTGFLTSNVSSYTDQIPGHTSTWYTYPGP